MTDTGQYNGSAYAHLIEGLPVDTSGHWMEWEWDRTSPGTSYDRARLEEYRDSVIVAYRLYNRIGLEHIRRMLAAAPHDAGLLDAGGGTGRKAIPLAQDGFTDITVLDIVEAIEGTFITDSGELLQKNGTYYQRLIEALRHASQDAARILRRSTLADLVGASEEPTTRTAASLSSQPSLTTANFSPDPLS